MLTRPTDAACTQTAACAAAGVLLLVTGVKVCVSGDSVVPCLPAVPLPAGRN
jgi:hypothetical protein